MIIEIPDERIAIWENFLREHQQDMPENWEQMIIDIVEEEISGE